MRGLAILPVSRQSSRRFVLCDLAAVRHVSREHIAWPILAKYSARRHGLIPSSEGNGVCLGFDQHIIFEKLHCVTAVCVCLCPISIFQAALHFDARPRRSCMLVSGHLREMKREGLCAMWGGLENIPAVPADSELSVVDWILWECVWVCLALSTEDADVGALTAA